MSPEITPANYRMNRGAIFFRGTYCAENGKFIGTCVLFVGCVKLCLKSTGARTVGRRRIVAGLGDMRWRASAHIRNTQWNTAIRP